MSPLRAQSVGISHQANDFIAWKEDEFRLWFKALNNRIDRGEGLFVQCARHARTGVAIQDELVAFAARQNRGDGRIHGIDDLALRGIGSEHGDFR